MRLHPTCTACTAGAILALACAVAVPRPHPPAASGEIVAVEATVLGRDGTPVRNLSKESFHLFEDGKEQTILEFEEVADSSAQGGGRPKAVVMMFDETHLTGGQFQRTRDAAEKFVRDHMRQGDYFAVAAHGSALRVVQSFTSDPTRILQGIAQPSPGAESAPVSTSSNTSAATSASRRPGQPPQDARAPSSLSFQSASYKATPLLRALQALAGSLAQVRNRKAVLLFSEEFSAPANLHNELEQTVDSARHANVVFFTVDARGLNSQGGGGAARDGTGEIAPQRPARGRPSDVDWNQFDRQAMEDVLRLLALQTGGSAIYNTSDFDERLEAVNREIGNYYVLRFRPARGRRDGSFREIEVKTDIKGVEVKHRPGYFPSGGPDLLLGSKGEKTLLAVLSSAPPASKIAVTARAGYFYPRAGRATVPVVARISAAGIQVGKEGGQLGTDLSIMGAAFAEDGTVAGRFSETQHITFDKEAESNFRRQNLVYRNSFKLQPGKYELRVAVADEYGNAGSAGQQFAVPPAEGRIAVSSLFVADQVVRMPEIIQGLDPGLLEDSDALTFSGVQVVTSPDHSFAAGALVPLFFKLRNVPAGAETAKLQARVQLLGQDGAPSSETRVALQKFMFPAAGGDVVVGMNLPFDKPAPGKYRVAISLSGAGPDESTSLETDLDIR